MCVYTIVWYPGLSVKTINHNMATVERECAKIAKQIPDRTERWKGRKKYIWKMICVEMDVGMQMQMQEKNLEERITLGLQVQ